MWTYGTTARQRTRAKQSYLEGKRVGGDDGSTDDLAVLIVGREFAGQEEIQRHTG